MSSAPNLLVLAPGVRYQEAQVRIDITALLLFGGARVERHLQAFAIEGAARAHVDLAGEAGFDLVGGARLEDVDLRDEVGGNVLQRQAAAHAGEHIAAVPGGGDVGETADRNAVGFTAAAVGDLHAGHSLQRFDDVVVGQLADVLGDDRLDDLRVFLLVLQALAQRLADTGDDDGFHLFASRSLLAVGNGRDG